MEEEATAGGDDVASGPAMPSSSSQTLTTRPRTSVKKLSFSIYSYLLF